MGDRNEHSDMIPYVIAWIVGLVIINLVWKWLMGGVGAIIEATPLR